MPPRRAYRAPQPRFYSGNADSSESSSISSSSSTVSRILGRLPDSFEVDDLDHDSDHRVFRGGPSGVQDEPEESEESEPEEDPEEDPEEEAEPVMSQVEAPVEDKEVFDNDLFMYTFEPEPPQPRAEPEQTVRDLFGTPHPAPPMPKSPVYIEISSDSAMSIERSSSPAPVESGAATAPVPSPQPDPQSHPGYFTTLTASASLQYWEPNLEPVGRKPVPVVRDWPAPMNPPFSSAPPTATPDAQVPKAEDSAADKDPFGIGAFIARQDRKDGLATKPVSRWEFGQGSGQGSGKGSKPKEEGSGSDFLSRMFRENGFLSSEARRMSASPYGWGRVSSEYYGSSGSRQDYGASREGREFAYSSGPSMLHMVPCRSCGMYGHRTYACPYSTQYRTPPTGLVPPHIRCYTCGLHGHLATECPSAHPELAPGQCTPPASPEKVDRNNSPKTLENRMCSRCRNPRTPSP